MLFFVDMKVYLQEEEKVIYEGYPQPVILVLWFFKALFFAVIISFFINTFLTVLTRNFTSYGINYFLVFIPVLVISFIYQIFLRRSYHYYITNERVIFQGGILLRQIKNVPYHKVTDVSIYQNIIERIIGISTLNVHTAGTGVQMPEIRFVGLYNPEKPHMFILKELKAFKSDKRHSSISD